MKNVKEILEQNHSKKSKTELIQLLQTLETVLGPEKYQEVNGLLPSDAASDLEGKKVGSLRTIIQEFSKSYDQSWEKGLKSLSAEALKLFQQATNDFRALDESVAADAGFAAELGSIDFATIIGGPLDACVKAQNNASLSTANFIQEVGFVEKDVDGVKTKELRYADFTYTRSVPNPDFKPDVAEGEANPRTIPQTVDLKVPFISILNIPSIRIETCEVNFNVKLNSTYTKEVKDNLKVDVGVKGGWGPVKFKVDVSYQRSTSTGIKVEKEYSLGVKVVATNDALPAGLEKVLGALTS